MVHLKLHITFPEEKIKEPIIYNLGKEFNVVTSIRRANVEDNTGWMDVELVGNPEDVEHAFDYLKKQGLMVAPVERNIVE